MPLLKKLDNEQTMSEFMFYVGEKAYHSGSKKAIDDYICEKLGYTDSLNLAQRTYDDIYSICLCMRNYVLNHTSDHIPETLIKMDSDIRRYGSRHSWFERFFICQMWLYFMEFKNYRIRKCERCNKAFVGSRLGQKYCSCKCKNAAGQRKSRAGKLEVA